MKVNFVTAGLIGLMTAVLWKEFSLPLMATFKIVLGSSGMATAMASILIFLLHPSGGLSWNIGHKLMGLWMMLPSLLITFILFEAFGFTGGLEGTIFVLAFCKFPFLFYALSQGPLYLRSLTPLVILSRPSFWQKIKYIYGPLFLSLMRKQSGIQASYAMGSFSVPLLLCAGQDRPLTTTIFYMVFEGERFGMAAVLLTYGALWAFFLNRSWGLPYLNLSSEPHLHRVKGELKVWQKLAAAAAVGGLLYPFIIQAAKTLSYVGKYGIEVTEILPAALSSISISLLASLLTLVISFGAVWWHPSLSGWMSRVPLMLPSIFWGIGVGGTSIVYDFPPFTGGILYFLLLAFMAQPYVLSLLLPAKRRVTQLLGPLMQTSRLSRIQRLCYIAWPYFRRELTLSFLYIFALSLGEITLFLCLAPFEASPLSFQLYQALSHFDWTQARVIAAVMMILFMTVSWGIRKHADT